MIALSVRSMVELGHKDIIMPIVLDKSLQELGRGDLLLELTYKEVADMSNWWGLSRHVLYIEAVKLTEVATGQR